MILSGSTPIEARPGLHPVGHRDRRCAQGNPCLLVLFPALRIDQQPARARDGSPALVEREHHRVVLVHVGDDDGTHLARSALCRLHQRQVVDVDGIERTDFRDQLSDPASPACVVEPEQRDVRCVAPPSLQLVLRGDGVNDQRIERRRQRRRSLPAPPAQQVDLVTALQQGGRLVLDADIRRERRLEQHEDPQHRLLSQPFPSRVPRSIRAEQHPESLESGVGSPALPPPRRSSPALLGHRSQPFEDVVSNRVGLEHLRVPPRGPRG